MSLSLALRGRGLKSNPVSQLLWESLVSTARVRRNLYRARMTNMHFELSALLHVSELSNQLDKLVHVHLGEPLITYHPRMAWDIQGDGKETSSATQRVSTKFFRPDHWPKHQTKWSQQQI
jgi:hypothetical protein